MPPARLPRRRGRGEGRRPRATPARSEGLAEASGIAAFEDWEALVDEPAVEVIDLAYPPDVQPGLIRAIVERDAGIRGILAQKPLGATLEGAREAVEACEEHGVVLGVNQNMRYDHSIRALKSLLEEGRLGEPVMAQITMHTRVGWMPYADEYPRKGMLIMSIHHLDAFRFLFGDPESITTTVRSNPDSEDEVDEMAVYTLAYPGRPARGRDRQHLRHPRPGNRVAGRRQRGDGRGDGRLDGPPMGEPQHPALHRRRAARRRDRTALDRTLVPGRVLGDDGRGSAGGRERRHPEHQRPRQPADDGAARGGLPIRRAGAHGRALRGRGS